jgi:hypothetical protein
VAAWIVTNYTPIRRGKIPPAVAAAAAADRGYIPVTYRSPEREWYGWTNPAGNAAISWRDASWEETVKPVFEAAFSIEGGMDPTKGAVRYMTNHGLFAARVGGSRMEAIPGWPD